MPPKTKAKPKAKPCKEFIKKDDGTLAVCNQMILDFTCPGVKGHILKFPTGFCSVGFCEGTAAKSASGKAAKTCAMWQVCPCTCHKMFDKMFSESGMPRQPVESSGYVPEHNRYWMPSPEERAIAASLSSPTVTPAPVIIESPAPDRVPVTVARTFAATATGRAARGELELWVKKVCDEWLVENDGSLCVPSHVAKSIAKTEGLGKEPSVGAIGAVWDRWAALGFAVIARKPVRFISYTEEGVRLGLDAMKERAKRQHKMRQAAADRGVR